MTYKQKLQQRAIKNQRWNAISKFGPFEIILSPVVTEKSYKDQESYNKYSFKIHKDANRTDVKKAIKYIFNVEPTKVNIVNVVFKWRMQRKLVRRSYKKAIITLNKKDKINIHA